jgi:hypothetical protein
MEIIDNGRDIWLKRKHQPFKVDWVRLPTTWIDKLEQSNNSSTHKLAHRILMEAFKREQVGGTCAWQLPAQRAGGGCFFMKCREPDLAAVR